MLVALSLHVSEMMFFEQSTVTLSKCYVLDVSVMVRPYIISLLYDMFRFRLRLVTFCLETQPGLKDSVV